MSGIGVNYALQKGDFRLDVDTKIPSTGVTGVFGASGSGKTTLLRSIAGLERSDGGRPVHERRIGFVFQEPQLFGHLDVRRNIDYGRRRSPAASVDVDSVVDMLGIGGLMDRKPASLSGGEAQRVAIARALCQSPTLILMDEPLSALDQARKDEVLPFLDRLRAETQVPIVYVSHSIDEICRLADHLLVLDAGRLVAAGELQTTLTRTDVSALGGAKAGTVVDAERTAYDDEHDLTQFRFSGGTLWAPRRYEAERVRLRIAASDVSLTLAPAESTTILNILPATVDAVEPESRSTCLVRLRCGDDLLLARITHRSLTALRIDVGSRVYAQIKSVIVRR